ncbi:MAG: hypothetical protein V4524_03810 [Patescibacteria group bacterium]
MIAFAGQFERGPQELIPNREEVLEIMARLTEGKEREVLREAHDAAGLYLLEIKVAGDKIGDSIHYEYRRKGTYPEMSSAETAVSMEFYEGDKWIGGRNLTEFNPETGEWKAMW